MEGIFLDFLRQIPQAAAVFSSDGTLKKLNDDYQVLFGVSNPALLENHYNIFQDEIWSGNLGTLQRVFHGETVLSQTMHFPLAKAEKRFGLEKKNTLIMDVTAFPLMHERSQVKYVIVTFKDISEQYERQIQLAESEKRYRTLTEALPDMLFCVAPDQTVLLVNNFSARQFNMTPEQIAGKKLSELFPKPVFERMWKNIEVVFNTAKGIYTENKTDFRGNVLWLDTWLVPLCDSQGTPYAIMGVSRDITEKVKYREELERTRNLESLGILAGGIAHDFNNILTSIQGNLSLLHEKCRSCTEKYPLIEQVNKATERAKKLTQQLLTFSKGGAPVKEQSSIKELILDSTGFVIHGSTVRSEFSIPDDLWPCELDAGQISQVIQNLTINALQAMSEGGVITVSAKNAVLEEGHASGKCGRYICISIQDRGSGIPEENLEKVFIPFFTTKDSGNGLGLSICYSIIKRHDGFINIESKMGKGTTVHFSLPAAELSGTAKNEDAYNIKTVKKSGKRILVVDDEPLVRSTLEQILVHFGCQPTLAADGNEGLNLYREYQKEGNPFHAVILDLTIPGGAGGSVIINELKKIDANVNAIVSSGYSNSPILANPAQFGFKAVLKKPFTFAELENALDQALR